MRTQAYLLMVLVLLLTTATVQAQFVPCPPDYAGYLPPRLQVGGQARVEPGTDPNRIRTSPQLTGTQIGSISAGNVAEVIFGPSCDSASQIIWWQVSFDNIVGWTAEGVLPDDYFLEPVGGRVVSVTPPVTPTLPDERSAITLSNVSSLAPVLTLPVSDVNDIAFTADQSLVAFASFNSGALVYRLPTLFEEPTLSNRNQGARSVALSPDGRYFAYGTVNDIIAIADVEAGGRVIQLDTPQPEGINALAFSPDGSYRLAVGTGTLYGGIADEFAGLYDVPANRVIAEFDASFWVTDVAFNHDGTQFAWADTVLHVFDVETGAEFAPAGDAPIYGPVAFSPDGAAIAYINDGIVLLPLDPKRPARYYQAPAGVSISTIVFNPAGTLLAILGVPGPETSGGSVVTIFDVQTGDIVFQQGSSSGRTLAFSPDGTLLVVAYNEEVVSLAVP